MPRFVGAIDQGTTSSRFIIFDEAGRVISVAQTEHAQHYPRPGWVEHDPLEILRTVRETAAEALIRADLTAADLAAVGITNQRETTVLWDRRTGRPLHNAIVWQDARVDDRVAALAAAHGPEALRQKTGLPWASYFSALKLQWLFDHVAGAREAAAAGDALFGTMDSWLAWCLTGGVEGGLHVTDVTNASRTQLMDLHTLEWCPELLGLFGIPRACLPRIVSSSAVLGTLRMELAGVTLAGLLGDQHAALVGQACFAPGEAKNTYGTGNFLLLNTGGKPRFSSAGLITTVAYRFGDDAPRYALEGAIANTGSVVQWLRDGLGLVGSAKELDALAGSVPDNGGVYLVPAFSGLYAPYWRADARGVIAGLTRFVTKAHVCRAALEAAAYQTADVVRVMQDDAGVRLPALRVDGGMAASDILMQFQADILDMEVVRPGVTETTALGAAYAAGLAVGVWGGLDAIKEQWRVDRMWRPGMQAATRDELVAGWGRAVERSFGWETLPLPAV
jgi:glycerol kinase